MTHLDAEPGLALTEPATIFEVPAAAPGDPLASEQPAEEES